jgi:hypothetical protein
MQGMGFLAIWSDISPEIETDYLHWLTREHTTERVSIPGFLSVRVFRALHVDVHRFFIHYELQNAGVVGSQEYLDRLNAPTPWSQRMMPNLGNFVRGGGRVLASSGTGRGGFIAAIALASAFPGEPQTVIRKLTQMDRIASVRVFATDDTQTSISTSEKSLRAKDSSFKSLLVIEALDEDALAAALRSLPTWAPSLLEAAIARPDLYSNIFCLDRRLIPGIAN